MKTRNHHSPSVDGQEETGHLGWVSLDTAIALTGMSKRTLWRRIADGELRKAEAGEGKARLLLADVLALADLRLDEATQALLLQADQGQAAAQLELALLFCAEGEPADERNGTGVVFSERGVRWLQQAVAQGQADAMQYLACCYATGEGVAANENLAMMWLAKAAEAGHPIALAQMNRLSQAIKSPGTVDISGLSAG